MSKKSRQQKDVEKYRKQSMTKKALKEYHKKNRGALFKDVPQIFKSAKDYNRREEKRKAKEAQRGIEK